MADTIRSFFAYLKSIYSTLIVIFVIGVVETVSAVGAFGIELADCDNGNLVPSNHKEWCDVDKNKPKRFAIYKDLNSSPVDARIKQALLGSATAEAAIRSFALIVAISHYPSWDEEHRDLPGVEVDVQRLIEFLDKQGYDEVLVLRDDATIHDASSEAISDALELFRIKTESYRDKSRFMFIYDGHGKPPDESTIYDGLALSGIVSGKDRSAEHIFDYATLRLDLRKIAANAFHTLALIGTCYSGNAFDEGSAVFNVAVNPTAHGALAATSADKDSVAYMMKDQHLGSVFFNTFFEIFDQLHTSIIHYTDTDGREADTVEATLGFEKFVILLAEQLRLKKNPKTGEPMGSILFGSIAPPDLHYYGVPFFLLPLDTEATAAVASYTGSGIKGNKNASVYRSPTSYRVQGIDLSSANKNVNLNQLANEDGVYFVYHRATIGSYKTDDKFQDRAKEADGVGLRFGAYHVYDPCDNLEGQLTQLLKVANPVRSMLPIAIDVENFTRDMHNQAVSCKSLDERRADLSHFAHMVEGAYGKKPIIYIPVGEGSAVRSAVAEFPLWVAYWTKAKSPTPDFIGKPWAVWQFSDRVRFRGLNMEYGDANVFFGDEKQFEAFSNEGKDVAVEAVQ